MSEDQFRLPSENLNTATPGGPTLYRPSGRVPTRSLVLAAVILIPLGILLGLLYSVAVVYLPFVKFRGLVTFLTGAGLGLIAGKLCYALNYRNRFLAILTILGFTAVFYYSSWATHMPLVIGAEELGDGFLPMMLQCFDPRVIYSWASYIFTEGIWAEGNGKPVSGWFAAGIWAVEAGFIFIMSYVTGVGAYGNRPFCENCDRWNEETQELAILPVSATDPAWAQVRTGNLHAIRKLQLVTERDGTYVELRLADCPTCDESDFLSAIGITLTMNDGELKKNESDIFRHMSVSRQQRDEIIDFATELAEAVQEMDEAAAEEFGEERGESDGNG